MKWIQLLGRFYRTRVDPFFYKNRLTRRLATYDLDVESPMLAAKLDLALGCPCSEPLCNYLSVTYGGYFDQFFYSAQTEDAPLYSKLTLHAIDLTRYASFSDYRLELGKRSSFFIRDAKHATKLQYEAHEFDPSLHLEEMSEIVNSMGVRSFGPIWPSWLLFNDPHEAFFKKVPPNFNPCSLHWERFIGVFAQESDQQEGNPIKVPKLVGYACLQRIGNCVSYESLIGHSDFLPDGIMKLLHCHVLHWLLDANNPDVLGLEYVVHGSIERGNEGIFFWKKKALFAPYLVDLVGLGLPEDFKEADYLRLNPDVADSGLSAASHYKIHGVQEQRLHKAPLETESLNLEDIPPDFDPEEYLRLNPDVAAADFDAALHYTLHGAQEGRCYRSPAR